jgi:hypothetical protein
LQGFFNNAISAMITYPTFEKKPSIRIKHELQEGFTLLLSAA